MSELLPKTVGVVTAYLIGSISFALIAGFIVRGVDIRTLGSHNIGATNVGRVLGRAWGWLVYFLDFSKGVVAALFLPAWIAGAFQVDWDLRRAGLYFGVCAVVGHMFPFYLRFRGGKGVATGSGMFLAVLPVPTLIAVGLWAATLVLFRYMALSSIVAALSIPFSIVLIERSNFWHTEREIFLVTSLMSMLVVARHTANIGRMLTGTENRIGGEHDLPRHDLQHGGLHASGGHARSRTTDSHARITGTHQRVDPDREGRR